MSDPSDRAAGDVIRDVRSVADLLREPRLAQLYAHLVREEEAAVQEVTDALDLTPETADTYLTRLIDSGILEATTDDQPRRYVARDIDLTVAAAAAHEYTITPALIDAVGRRRTNDDIETYIDRHGIADLATALTYAVDRERGKTTHRRVAQDLDLSPLEAETILQALRSVVHDHFDVEVSGASVADLDGATCNECRANVSMTRRGPFVAEYDTGALCGYCSYDCYFSHRHRNNLEEIAGEQSVYIPPA